VSEVSIAADALHMERAAKPSILASWRGLAPPEGPPGNAKALGGDDPGKYGPKGEIVPTGARPRGRSRGSVNLPTAAPRNSQSSLVPLCPRPRVTRAVYSGPPRSAGPCEGGWARGRGRSQNLNEGGWFRWSWRMRR
jgi:hypothetical protein